MPSIQQLPEEPSGKRLYILDTALGTPGHTGGRIISTSTAGTETHDIVSSISTLPDGISIDHASGHMYVTHMGTSLSSDSGSIVRYNLDGSDATTVIPAGTLGVWTPKQITFVEDAGSKWVYWCDREGMKVMRACVDTVPAQAEVLVDTGDAQRGDGKDCRNWCVGIAVDVARQGIYWTQKGASKGNAGRILRKKIGEVAAESEVLFSGLPEPIDLEFEAEGQVLYWTDRGDPPKGNSLNRAYVGGKTPGPVEILATRLHEAIGLAVDTEQGKAYVSDLSGGVYEIDLGSRKKKVLFGELGDLTGIALV